MTLPAVVEAIKREKVTEAAFVDADAVFVSQELTDIRSEAAVIGAVLREPDTYIDIAHLLQPGDFYDRFHGACWGVFDQIVSKGKKPDYNLVADGLLVLNLSFIPPEADTITRLTGMMGAVPNIANVEEYSHKVRKLARWRRVYKACREKIPNMLKNRELREDEECLIDAINEVLFEASEQNAESDKSMVDAVNQYMLEKNAMRDGELPPPFPTGIPVLSNLLGGGWWNGYIHILAGLQGKGKTTLYLSCVRARCKEMLASGEDGVIVVFSLEMTSSEIIDSLTAMESGLPITLLRNPRAMNTRQLLKFKLAMQRIQQFPLVIVDDYRLLTVQQMKRRIRRIQRQHNVKLVIIDGLWRMRVSSKDGDQIDDKLRHIAVDKILNNLSELISKPRGGFYFPLVLTHQYRESILQKKTSKMFPVEEDLAQSSAARHTPQIILGMFDPRWLGKVNIENTTRVYRMKARGIPNLGDNIAHLHFHTKYARYDDARRGYGELEDDELTAIDNLTDDELIEHIDF